MQVVLVVLLAILSFANCDSDSCAIDLALILDDSGSISNKSDWPNVKLFAKKVVHNLGDVSQLGSHVAVLKYSNYPVVHVKFNTFKGDDLNTKEIDRSIDNMKKSKGLTFIDRALKMADKEVFTAKSGMREDKEKVAIIMTDGKQTISNGSYTLLKYAAQPLKDKGVNIFVVGVGPDLNLQELVDMATIPNNVYTALTFGDLVKKVTDLKIKSCPTPTPTTECQGKVDVGIILDESSSVGEKDFKKALNAIEDLAKVLNIGPDGSHVGMIRYGLDQKTPYRFSPVKLQTFTAFKNKMDKLKSRYGDSEGTNTWKALELARKEFFKQGTPGNRENVPDVAILFTDGVTQDNNWKKVECATCKFLKGIKTIVIGIGREVTKPDLLPFAENHPENVIMVSNFDELQNKIVDISYKATCGKD